MKDLNVGWLAASFVAVFALWCGVSARAQGPQRGRKSEAPRDEIKPEFSFNPKGGPDGRGGWIVRSDSREGLHGFWTRAIAITGGKHYRFTAYRRTQNVQTPRRSALVRLLWQDAEGKS